MANRAGVPHVRTSSWPTTGAGSAGRSSAGLPRRVGFDGRLPDLVGRRLPPLGRLLAPGGAPADRRPAGRPDLDGQRPRRRRRDAGEARQRRLRPRRPGAADPRRPAAARRATEADMLARPARRPGPVPGALARPAAGDADPGGRRRATRSARAAAADGDEVDRAGLGRLGRLPGGAGSSAASLEEQVFVVADRPGGRAGR